MGPTLLLKPGLLMRRLPWKMPPMGKLRDRSGSSLVAGGGANARRFMAATTGLGERTRCWTLSVTRRRFGHSSSIRRGRGAALGAKFLKLAKLGLARQDSLATKW